MSMSNCSEEMNAFGAAGWVYLPSNIHFCSLEEAASLEHASEEPKYQLSSKKRFRSYDLRSYSTGHKMARFAQQGLQRTSFAAKQKHLVKQVPRI